MIETYLQVSFHFKALHHVHHEILSSMCENDMKILMTLHIKGGKVGQLRSAGGYSQHFGCDMLVVGLALR